MRSKVLKRSLKVPEEMESYVVDYLKQYHLSIEEFTHLAIAGALRSAPSEQDLKELREETFRPPDKRAKDAKIAITNLKSMIEEWNNWKNSGSVPSKKAQRSGDVEIP